MAQSTRVANRKDSVITQRWDRFKRQFERCKGGINASLVLTSALHVAKIVIGSLYINDCPAEKKIPIFLIVAGVAGILSRALTLSRDYLIKYIKVKPILSFIGTFEFIWFICGCVWVFQILSPSYDPIDGERYCQRTVYTFSLVYICLLLAVMVLTIGVILLIACCCCCCAGVLTLVCPDEEEVERTGADN